MTWPSAAPWTQPNRMWGTSYLVGFGPDISKTMRIRASSAHSPRSIESNSSVSARKWEWNCTSSANAAGECFGTSARRSVVTLVSSVRAAAASSAVPSTAAVATSRGNGARGTTRRACIGRTALSVRSTLEDPHSLTPAHSSSALQMLCQSDSATAGLKRLPRPSSCSRRHRSWSTKRSRTCPRNCDVATGRVLLYDRTDSSTSVRSAPERCKLPTTASTSVESAGGDGADGDG